MNTTTKDGGSAVDFEVCPAGTMAEVERLRARIAELETALRVADCPYPVQPARNESVGACVDVGCCGCRIGTPLQEGTP